MALFWGPWLVDAWSLSLFVEPETLSFWVITRGKVEENQHRITPKMYQFLIACKFSTPVPSESYRRSGAYPNEPAPECEEELETPKKISLSVGVVTGLDLPHAAG